MIANSDNSATNMLLYEIGGMDGFNRAMRNLGLKATSIHEWLPDLEGTNKITAREISKILYIHAISIGVNHFYGDVFQHKIGCRNVFCCFVNHGCVFDFRQKIWLTFDKLQANVFSF